MLKNYFIKITFVLTVIFSLSATAQNTSKLWTSISEQKAEQTEQVIRRVELKSEKFFQLNLEALKHTLENVGDRNNIGNTIISFPNSEGVLSEFKVFEASIMEPELQEKYPNTRSYAGQGIDNPTEIVRFSITSKGLHAMFLGTERGTQFIDPFSKDGNIYTVYSKKDLLERNFEFECGVIDDDSLSNRATFEEPAERNANDGTLRNYRIAIACTGEYTQFHGGTVADAMAAIAVTLTRVNGIYERDLSITMTLVANNEAIIYTDGDDDPFTNSNQSILIGQSQSVITSTIGSANFDVGHTFSTGGGGLAGLGVTCNTNSKASGITGSSQPVGDAYDIDFVAHELGHQFGGPHTFNGTNGNCTTNSRSGANAYEPGSGSTIMAYAGICGSDNIQNNSDAYFHQASINRIWAHVTSTGSCPVSRTSTGNTEPVANAGVNYTIPQGTPYKLDGSNSTDVDGTETLTYTWEQYDLGSAGLPTETTTTGPLVRSFEGTESPVRYVPQLSEVLTNGGTSTTWEKLSSVNRSIDFMLTVRDNDARGGQTDSDEMTITNVTAAGPFTVTSQSTDQIVWTPGDTETITWNVAGTTSNGVNASNVNILLSTDEGLTYTTILASNVSNDGSHDITVPNVSGAKCRVMVEGAGNIFYNVNTAFFAVGNYVYESVDVCESYTFDFGGLTVPESTTNYSGYSLNVPVSLIMTDANISVDITHPDSGDLYYGFRHPEYSGTFIIELASQECSGSANPNFVFDDEGSVINCGTISNGDAVIPENALSEVDGTDSQGDWSFFILDSTIDNTISSINSITIEVCQSSSEAVLSVQDNELEALSIYPNPNNGEFNVQFNSTSGEAVAINVYDIRGRSIYSQNFDNVGTFNEAIKLNNAQSGVYLLTIIDGTKKVTKKIIVD
ncbi:T9SS type A sorting domain-containing protein [Winogradskyella undariae]|uniref:zinc-dependent metalloprotease n=1 Tax=Winogradskyella undariae TaxID=1285465 RepID=UPI00156B4626|nr:zinc-dependent metalloprotease [Winogradskyella undariae]NRR91348.1 T9SS type A sorting domain-containing protein [Winogradskyella undariae]